MGTPAQFIEQSMMSGYDQAHDRKVQRKDMLSDEDRQIKATDLINTRNSLLTKLPTLLGPNGEKTPEYDQAYQSLTQAQEGLGQLYHPDKAPGALQKDWHFLLEKMHGITVPKDKTPSSITSQAPDATINTPATLTQTLDLPADQKTGQAEVPSVTMPTMAGSVTLPAPSPVTVTKAPTPPWGQAQVLKQRAASMQKAQDQVGLMTAGLPASPEQQAMAQFRTDQANIDESLKLAEKLGITGTALDEFKQQLAGIKNVSPKPLTGEAGRPYKGPDGLYRQAVTNPDGMIGFRQMPPDWKPNTKAVRGTLINTKSNGWVQTWVDPYNPSKVIGFQKVTPGSRYTGSTSSSSSTDPFGLTTSTSRSTTPTSGSNPVDVDLSGMQQLPENYNGEDIPESNAPAGGSAPNATPTPSGSPNKTPVSTTAPPRTVTNTVTGAAANPPKIGATQAQLKSRIPAPPPSFGTAFPLDATGHIPANAHANPQLIEAANQLLDGMDIEKLTIPQKAREAASALARQYGWGGQGMFNPQQKLQVREASTFLNDAVKSPALSVLDSRISREKLIAALNNSEGHAGWTDALVARNFNLDPKEAEFLRMYRQLTGTISGIASLTRPGRPTEAGIKRLMFELPNPNESHSAADAKERLKRLIKEIDIATQRGNADNIFGGAASSDANAKGGLTADSFREKYLGKN